MKLTDEQCKAFGLRIKPAKSKAQIRREWQDNARALPAETRQAMLDALHDGKTLGEVARGFDVDIYTVCGLIDINMDQLQFLRDKTV